MKRLNMQSAILIFTVSAAVICTNCGREDTRPAVHATIHSAVEAQDIRDIRRHIAGGSYVGEMDEKGRTPMHIAAAMGNTAIIEVLVAEGGASVLVKDRVGCTPLHRACENGKKEAVEILLAMGADINARNRQRMTPLGMAERAGHQEIAQLLRNEGARR